MNFDGYHAVGVWAGSLVSMKDCTLVDNNIIPFAKGSAVIQADSYDDAFRDTEVRLEGCTFGNNSFGEISFSDPTFTNTSAAMATLLADNREDEVQQAVFYSDSQSPAVCVYEGHNQSSIPPPCDMSKPKPLSRAKDVFLTPFTPWLLSVKQVRGPQNPASACYDSRCHQNIPSLLRKAQVEKCLAGDWTVARLWDRRTSSGRKLRSKLQRQSRATEWTVPTGLQRA